MSSQSEKGDDDRTFPEQTGDDDLDAPYGGRQARLALERKLLWKIDIRMFVMVLIYILNYVSSAIFCFMLTCEDRQK